MLVFGDDWFSLCRDFSDSDAIHRRKNSKKHSAYLSVFLVFSEFRLTPQVKQRLVQVMKQKAASYK